MAVQSDRKILYEKRRKELEKHCTNCKTRYYERCNDCIWGKKLRWLQTEYSDVTGWSHLLWKDNQAI